MQIKPDKTQRIIAIPARLASSRFPEKVLADLLGKPMIQRTYERALLAKVDRVLIVTDSKKVASVAEGFGAEVFISQAPHESGTSRIAEAVQALGIDDTALVLNLQADEPVIPLNNITQVFENLEKHKAAAVATLCEKIQDRSDLISPSCVKVVRDKYDYALYFSRSVIPYSSNQSVDSHFRHIGLYCFQAGFLKTLDGAEPSRLQQQESLEQLSFLYDGHKIHVEEAREVSLPGVDLPSDLARVEAFLKGSVHHE